MTGAEGHACPLIDAARPNPELGYSVAEQEAVLGGYLPPRTLWPKFNALRRC